MGLQQESNGRMTRPARGQRWTFVGLTFGLCLMAQSAMAKEVGTYPPCAHIPTENDVAAAQGAYKAGQVSFQEADYERALLYWEDAFRRDCTAVKLLLNIARAYELSGELSGAVNALETYLERAPDAEDRASVEKRMARLNERLDEERASAAAATPAPSTPERDETSSAEATQSAPTKPAWPVVLTASGVAGIIIGTTVGVLGAVDVGDEKDRIAGEFSTADGAQCERDGRRWNCPGELLDEVELALDNSDELKRAETMRTVGIVVGAGGAVLTGVGAYFWYKLWSASSSRDVARRGRTAQGLSAPVPLLVPQVSPHFAGLNFSAQF